MLTEEQLKERKNYIGASEAAAALGLSRWQTQLELWGIKTGRIEPKDLSDNVAVEMGNELEEVVARLFTKRTGLKVQRVNSAYVHDKYNFLRCHIDRKVVGQSAILQCKTCSAYKAKEWDGEEIPQEYIIQEYDELAITGYDKAYIAVLIGGQDFRIKEIYRTDEIIKDIIEKQLKFWQDFVLTDKMPMNIVAKDSSVLYDLYPISDTNADIILNDDVNIKIEQINSMIQDKIALEMQIEKNKNEIKAILGNAESGRTNNWRIQWKTQHKKEYVVKESHTRVFRISSIKE